MCSILRERRETRAFKERKNRIMKENRRKWLRAIWPLIAVLSHQSGKSRYFTKTFERYSLSLERKRGVCSYFVFATREFTQLTSFPSFPSAIAISNPVGHYRIYRRDEDERSIGHLCIRKLTRNVW